MNHIHDLSHDWLVTRGSWMGNPLNRIHFSNPFICLVQVLSSSQHSVQFSSVAQSCPTLSDQISRSVVSNCLQPHESQHTRPPCHHQLPPSIFPNIRIFSSESVHRIRWPKYWSFSFSISPSNEYSGLISFRRDWLYLPAVQGTLKGLFSNTTELMLSIFSILLN